MFNLIVVLLSIVIIAVVLVIGFNKINNKFVTKYGEYSDLELMIVNLKRKLETDKKDIEREIESLRKEENLKVKEEILAQKKTCWWRNKNNEIWNFIKRGKNLNLKKKKRRF